MPDPYRVRSPFRVDRLPAVSLHHWRARTKPALQKGELVYYGPLPEQYGIGEVQHIVGPFVCVDFRGTGLSSVHEDIIDERYLIPISDPARSLL